MTKEPYYLYSRTRCGRTVWSIYVKNEYGELTSQSLGVSTKAEAMEIAVERYKKGQLIIPKTKQKIVKQKYKSDCPEKLTFGDYSKDWWDYEKCEYVEMELARGHKISKSYCDTNRSALKMHILPFFQDYPLKDITPLLIDKWILTLNRSKKLKGKTIGNISSVLSLMLKEAVRKDLIDSNPYEKVKPFIKEKNPHGSFKQDEIKQLFSKEDLWSGHVDVMLANLLALCTGMREGEILALKGEDLDGNDNSIYVYKSFNRKYGEKSTKNGKNRYVPVPSLLLHQLRRISKGKKKYIFSLDGSRPFKGTTLTRWLYRALEKIGVDKEDRAKRNLTFHSWRHTFNSIAVTMGIPTNVVRTITGHSSEEMTRHYFHASDESNVTMLNASCNILSTATNTNIDSKI